MKLKLKISFVSLILCIFLITFFGSGGVLGEGEQNNRMEDDKNSNAETKPSLWEIVKNGFSLYTSSPLMIPSYLEKIKTLVNQGQAYLFRPNLEGRTQNIEAEPGSGGDASGRGGGGGAGEKVKEVVGKSFGKTKETLGDSAKSAANLVGETVQKTKEKVKRSFSDRENKGTESQSEL